MIVEVTMYGCRCDNCGIEWVDEHHGFAAFTDEISMKSQMADDHTWHTDRDAVEDRHYCPKCFSFNDDDELVITPIS